MEKGGDGILKKFWYIISITVLLATMYITPAVNAQEKEKVSLDTAKKAALNHLKQSVYAEKINTINDLHLKTYLYDVDDTLLGYYLTYKEKDNSYYILVSATTNHQPILQHGEGQLDYENDYQLNEGKKLYYLGPLQFLYGKDKNEINEKFKQKKDKWLKDLEKQNKESSQEYKDLIKKEIPRIKKDSKHADEWNNILSFNPVNQMSINTTATTTYKVLSVTRLWQRSSGVSSPNSACGPTTAAMVSNFLKSQGYNVKGVSDYSSTGSFINHMYNELGTSSLGSSMFQYLSGLNTHLEHNYTSNAWDAWSYRAYGYYSHYKDNILNNKPVGLRFDYWVSEGSYVNYHFVAGIGFNHGSIAEFAIKDPDGGSANTGSIWLNWNDNNDDMDMGLVNKVN